MSVEVVKAYDDVVAQLQEKHRNVDPFLMLKSSMLTRKYPKEPKQRFWLSLRCQHEMAEDASRRIQHMVGIIPSSHGHGHYELVLQTMLDTVLAIAAVPGVEWIGGEVFPNA